MKKTIGKLALSRETIRALCERELTRILGGAEMKKTVSDGATTCSAEQRAEDPTCPK